MKKIKTENTHTYTHNIQEPWGGDFKMHSQSIIEIPYEKREWDEKNIWGNNALLSNINDRHQITESAVSESENTLTQIKVKNKTKPYT